MRESYIEKKACEIATKHGWLTRKLKFIGRDGAPDRMFIRDGRVLFVEFKAPGKVPRPEQEHEIHALKTFGALVAVVDSIGFAEVLFQ